MLSINNPKNNSDEAGIQFLEDLTTNAKEVQQQVLEKILAQNINTEYLKGFLNGGGCIDKKVFKKNVPIVNYEDVKPYILRIANGEPSEIISAQPITELLTSSGTSGGQPKLIPSTAEDLDRKTYFYSLLMPVINKYVDGLDQGKGMYLLFIKPEISTPSGLMARPVLNSYYKSSFINDRTFNRFTVYTSPDETVFCLDSKQSMYCQLLCGLVQRHEVVRVGAVFASAFLRAIKFLEDHWKELCSNIRTGRVSDWVIDTGCRNAVSSILGKPNHDLADLIELECSSAGKSSSWEGIVKKLWPRTKYIDVIVTGSMAQYIPTLEYYSGGLPLISTMYASSECFFGINLQPLSKPCDVTYTILPHMAYFEFLPVEEEGQHEDHDDDVHYCCNNGTYTDMNGTAEKNDGRMEAEAIDLTNVKLGHYYEIVVTTFTGLYRYRVGDILMVAGFHNKAPQFRFVQRKNVVLSIDTDKTSEEDLLKAVTQAKLLIEPLGFLLTEYSSYADTASIPGHYVIFWELIKIKGDRRNNLEEEEEEEEVEEVDHPSNSIMEQCCHTVEESLDSVYRRCRKRDKSIGALEIRVVTHGTFDALMDFCVSQGSSVNQYKTLRFIKSVQALEILDSRTVGRFFSKNAPFWESLLD